MKFLPLSTETQFALLFAIFLGRTLILAGGSTLFTQLSAWARARRIVDQDTPWTQIFSDAGDAVLILLLDAVAVVASVKLGFLRIFEDATYLQTFGTFAVMFVWLEVFFYYSHRLLHRKELFWIHRHHHEVRPTKRAFRSPL